MLLSAAEYLSFFLMTSVAFGLVFELPLVLIFLTLVGVLSGAGLRRARPYAAVRSTGGAARALAGAADEPTIHATGSATIYGAQLVQDWLAEFHRRPGSRRCGSCPW